MSVPVKIINPRSNLSIDWQELWEYRELLYIFAWRDIKVRYKQTLVGVFWVLIQPLVNTIIFTFFFGGLAKIPSGDLPYQVFVFIGLIFWNFFTNSVSGASESFVSNYHIITKVYFPRMIIPLASLVTNSVDTLIMLLFFIIILPFLNVTIHLGILLVLPILLIFLFLTTAGLGLWFSSLNVKFRDMRYALPFITQTLLFLTPVIYPSTIIPDKYKWIISMNPLSSIIEITREFFSSTVDINYLHVSISAISAILIFFIGLYSFRKTEAYLADKV
jgi:lipopolysaccharide transport system permease protein